MTAAKQKGTTFETLIVRALNLFARGHLKAYRPAQAGFRDVGDVHGVSPFVLQAKAYKSLTEALRLGVDGAVKQAANAGEDYGVAVIKRPRRSIGEAYAVMRFEDFARVLLRLRAADELMGEYARDNKLAWRVSGDLARDFPTAADVARAQKEAA